MLRRTFNYEDLDGNPVEETYYFVLSKNDLRELRIGFVESDPILKQIILSVERAEDDTNKEETINKQLGEARSDVVRPLYNMIVAILMKSVGVKSADGRKIDKSQDVKDAFIDSVPFNQMMDELMDDDNGFSDFINQIKPQTASPHAVPQKAIRKTKNA